MYPQWEETQDNLKLTMMRNLHGLHAPMRTLMERKMVTMVSGLSFALGVLWCSFKPWKNPHMPAFPQSNIHLDILMGRDEVVEPGDVFGGACLGFWSYSLRLIGSLQSQYGHLRSISMPTWNESVEFSNLPCSCCRSTSIIQSFVLTNMVVLCRRVSRLQASRGGSVDKSAWQFQTMISRTKFHLQ